MSDITEEQIHAGQAVYSRPVLAMYDSVVLGVSCRWLWRCPSAQLLAHYNQHVTANHLDVGVGSGYFPDHCDFGTPSPRVALMDLNEESLRFAARRIERYRPETYVRNVLDDMSVERGNFDSVGMSLLLHCLPGNFQQKGVVFDHALAVMNPGALLFGATILGRDVPRNPPARGLMAAYNRKGIFCNREDSPDALRATLEQRLERVDIRIHGCMALFSGYRPG